MFKVYTEKRMPHAKKSYYYASEKEFYYSPFNLIQVIKVFDCFGWKCYLNSLITIEFTDLIIQQCRLPTFCNTFSTEASMRGLNIYSPPYP